MITVAVIGASRDAWGYLIDSIAQEHPKERTSSKAAYYFGAGTPPGIWYGTALPALGLTDGQQAETEHLNRIFGHAQHPLTGQQLGRKLTKPVNRDTRIRDRINQLPHTLTPTERDTRITQITAEETERTPKQGVAGFEFVCSPPKSVSVWWALADPDIKEHIRACHHTAITAVIKKLETDVIRTRTGTNGVATRPVTGISAAGFDHWDSREGDPQLHTHLLVSNRVQTSDGAWRTIDSRWSLLPAVATISAFYDTILMDELSKQFGVEWVTEQARDQPNNYQTWLSHTGQADSEPARHQYALTRSEKPGSIKWQLAAIPAPLTNEFSTRSKHIRVETDRKIRQHIHHHGSRPSPKQIITYRQQASLASRPPKKVLSLKDLTTSWRQRARTHIGDSFGFATRILTQAAPRLHQYPFWAFRADDIPPHAAEDIVHTVLTQLTAERASWTRRHAETFVLRALAGHRMRSPHDRDRLAGQLCDQVIAAAIPVTPNSDRVTPARFTTPDGASMFEPVTRQWYTTTEVWDAEERLLTAANTTTAPNIPVKQVTTRLAATPTNEPTLSPDQRHAITQIAVSGRRVDVLVGPAGAGKTTSLKQLRRLWEHHHGAGQVIGLAPTAKAASILADSLHIPTENTAKWLHDHPDTTAFQTGQLVIVDEASLAGTCALDRLRQQAEHANAKLLLVGDWAQLSAVDAGGVFGLLAATRTDTPELTQLHRFNNEWEKTASIRVRLGKPDTLDDYHQHERIHWDTDSTQLLDDIVSAWEHDTNTLGTTTGSLMIAATNQHVDQLNHIARTRRITGGQVDTSRETIIKCAHPDGGTTRCGAGDRIVTRQNARQLPVAGDRWVKNNDEWTITHVHDDGSLTVTSAAHTTGVPVHLPAWYVHEHVQLAYASTVYRAQGRTVTSAHLLVDHTTSREQLYVGLTRGTHSNRVYVNIEPDASEHVGDLMEPAGWRDVLEGVLERHSTGISAHQLHTEEHERIHHIGQLAAEHSTLAGELASETYLPLLTKHGLTKDPSNTPYHGVVCVLLDRIARTGTNPETILTHVINQRELHTANQTLAVIHYRLEHALTGLPKPNTPNSLIAGLIDTVPPPSRRNHRQDLWTAINDREILIQVRAEHVLDHALTTCQPWIQALGSPAPGQEESWRRHAVTIACYRDLYRIDTSEPVTTLDAEATKNRERLRHYQLTIHALTQIHAHSQHPASHPPTPGHTPTPHQAGHTPPAHPSPGR